MEIKIFRFIYFKVGSTNQIAYEAQGNIVPFGENLIP